MKPVILIVGMLIVVAYVLWPMVNDQRLCYETAKSKTDLYASNLLMGRWTAQKLCESRMDELSTLEACIRESTASGFMTQYVKDVIPAIIRMIRPYETEVLTQKSQHNNYCVNYRWTILP